MLFPGLASCTRRRGSIRRALAGLLGGAALLSALPAGASTTRWPAQHVDRDLVVPRHTLRIDGGPRWPLPTGQLSHYFISEGDDALILRPGVSFGVVDQLELGIAQPLLVVPEGDLQNPTFHGTYQFTRGGAVDAGVFWSAVIPYEGHFVLRAGVPLYIHASRKVRLDLGGFLRMELPEDNSTLDLEVPLVVPFNVTPELFLGPELAVITWGGFEDVALPLGFFIGYTVAGGGGLLGDFSLRFRETDVRSPDGFDNFELVFAADLLFDL